MFGFAVKKIDFGKTNSVKLVLVKNDLEIN
jgi:hypothetical protein